MKSRKRLVKKLVKQMTRVQRHLRSGQASAWAGLDLTMPQVKTLFLLAEGPMRMRGIAKRLGVEMPSATTMIDRLAAKGLVERRQDPADRRAVVCTVTPTGRDVVEKFWALRAARIESLASALSKKELEKVVPALEILAEAGLRAERGVETGPDEDCRRREQPGESAA